MTGTRSRNERFYRHRLPVRIAHWLNVLCMFIILLSGLQIFNAHPALYWGHDSDFESPWLSIGAYRDSEGKLEGRAYLGDRHIVTTGFLGVSSNADGEQERRAFPSWLTIPSSRWLAMGRNWHFFFAWILVINAAIYLAWSTFSGHLRDLTPTRTEWRGFGRSIVDHLLLRHPVGDAARRYNILQKLAYLLVIFGLGGLIVITGLCMSPRMDTVMDGIMSLLGGRQSARSLHFIAAVGFVLFVCIHLFEVVVTGLWNNLRSMITGQFDYPVEDDSASKKVEKSHEHS